MMSQRRMDAALKVNTTAQRDVGCRNIGGCSRVGPPVDLEEPTEAPARRSVPHDASQDAIG